MNRAILFLLLTALVSIVHGQNTDMTAWKTDYAAFKKAVTDNLPVLASKTDKDLVSWTAVFLSVEAVSVPNVGYRYDVHFDLPPIPTKDTHLKLTFTCEKAEFPKWQQVPKGTEVAFTADWLHMMLAFPNQPVETMFGDAKLIKVLTKPKDAK